MARWWLNSVHGDVVQGFILFSTFLSHWVVVATALIFTGVAIWPTGRAAWWWIGQCLIINIVMSLAFWAVTTVGHFIVDPIDLQFTHGGMPLLVAAYWLLLTNRGNITVGTTLSWLLLPLAYTAWMEAYGSITGFYPYWQLSPDVRGWAKVAISVGEILLVTTAIGLVLYAFDRWKRPVADSDAVPGDGRTG